MEFSSNGKGNAALATGIIGTALSGILTLGSGMNATRMVDGAYGMGCGHRFVTKDDLNYVQEIGRKDSEIALLKSEQNTEIKIADVYSRLKGDLLTMERQQNDVNSAQAVYNASANSAINLLQNQVAVLNGLTKVVVPAYNVCPRPMPMYNSWTAPTTAEAETTPTT